MGMPPHTKCCGCCCGLRIGTLIGSGIFIILCLAFIVLGSIAPEPMVEWAKEFCRGTTDKYREREPHPRAH